MRFLWEKIQEIKKNLSKNGRMPVYWMVSMRVYFSVNQADIDMAGKGPVNSNLGCVPMMVRSESAGTGE